MTTMRLSTDDTEGELLIQEILFILHIFYVESIVYYAGNIICTT